MEEECFQVGAIQSSASTNVNRVVDVLDVSGIKLPGEEEGWVPVYDTCTTIRQKISSFLRVHGVTQTAFLRAISNASGSHRKLQPVQLKRFLAKSGPLSGNTSGIYYLAYVFFEKTRLKNKKDKSPTRQKMEELHPDGMDTTRVVNHVWAPRDSRPVIDKYGIIRIET